MVLGAATTHPLDGAEALAARDGFAQPSVGVVQTLSMAILRRVL
jgi:hypothetical protein